MHEREAFLLPQYHLWFPCIRPGTWLRADLVAARVHEQLREHEPRWNIDARVLNPLHFAFRAGRQGGSRRVDRREDDLQA
ncbi:MAG: hypothetical protein ABJC36_07625 [Gemmatimonadales bacterium]